MREQRGFTLLELLMVVVIIAILASIALPQYLRASERSRAAEALQMLGAIRSAEQRFRALSPTGAYTSKVDELDIEVTNMNSWNNLTFNINAGPPATGFATVARSGGQFTGELIGTQFGSGTICGNFTALQPINACAAD